MTLSSNDDKAKEKKVYNVPDIYPGTGFVIEILERDGDQIPLKEVDFCYKVDDGEAHADKTNDNGILRIMPGPKEKVKLSLPG